MKTLILSGFGTNCEKETVYACRRAGAGEVDVRHINAIYNEGLALEEYRLLILIGGFMDGDDLGGARACANRFRFRTLPGGGTFLEALHGFVDQGRLVLGICNGFQLLANLGLLPGDETGAPQQVTMAPNANNRFEDRWVDMVADSGSPCVFTRGIKRLYLPVRHGEGKVIPKDKRVLRALEERHLIPIRYVAPNGGPTGYPDNPNGSVADMAGLCDPTGRIFGLMPHPEAYLYRTNHPRWTRERLPAVGQGVAVFRNAVRHVAEAKVHGWSQAS